MKKRKTVNVFYIVTMCLFLALVVAFMGIPLVRLISSSFTSQETGVKGSLDNFIEIFTSRYYRQSFRNSLVLSLESSIFGLTIALFCSYAITRFVKEKTQSNLLVIVNMTSNFAGLPLGFALTLMLGTTGLFIILLQNILDGINTSHLTGFAAANGLSAVYEYLKSGGASGNTLFEAFRALGYNVNSVEELTAFIADNSLGKLNHFLTDGGADISTIASLFTAAGWTVPEMAAFLEDFSIYSVDGLILAYTYFQVPLGIMLLYPIYRGIRADWKEAAGILGANSVQFWFRIGIPAILPSVLSTFTVLFANAMGAYATAYYLVSSSYNLVPIRISAMMSGDIRTKMNLGSALAVTLAMTLIVSMAINEWASHMAGRRGVKS